MNISIQRINFLNYTISSINSYNKWSTITQQPRITVKTYTNSLLHPVFICSDAKMETPEHCEICLRVTLKTPERVK